MSTTTQSNGITISTTTLPTTTISANTTIFPTTTGYSAVEIGPGYTNAIFNAGTLIGGIGGPESADAGAQGAAAAAIEGGTLNNTGLIIGGQGGLTATGKLEYANGGYGVDLTGGTVINLGTITGGGGYGDGIGHSGTGATINAGTLLNLGTISTGTFYDPVPGGPTNNGPALVEGGGYVVNQGSIITGTNLYSNGSNDVYVTGGTFINDGDIQGGATSLGHGTTAGIGIDIRSYGPPATIINNGTITGGANDAPGTNKYITTQGIAAYINNGTLDNFGTIRSNPSSTGPEQRTALVINSGTVTNNTGGLILGGTSLLTAVYVQSGEIINDSQISNTNGVAISLTPDVSGRPSTNTATLELGPESIVVGSIAANIHNHDTLILSNTTNAETTINTELNSISGFQTITFQGTGTDFETNLTSVDQKATIEGLNQNTITISDYAINPADTTYIAGTGLELTSEPTPILATPPAVTLDIAGTYTMSDFQITSGISGTTISLDANVPCFLAGTSILTTHGPIKVENLRVGTTLPKYQGGHTKIKWIGRRMIDPTSHHDQSKIIPVIIAKDSMGPNRPDLDLHLSPDHAIHFQGHLIPAKALINQDNVTQGTKRFGTIVYYHIELESHDLISANNIWCESYLDTGNRNGFESQTPTTGSTPDFGQIRRQQESCLPIAESGPVVELLRNHMLLMNELETTTEPDLRVTRQPNGDQIIHSRHGIPGHNTADPRDLRDLGVKVTSMTTTNGKTINLNHPDLKNGWHNSEPDGRWTNGKAMVPAHLIDDENTISVTYTGTNIYRFDDEPGERQRKAG